MTISSIIKQATCWSVVFSVLMSLTPNVIAADLNYTEDVTITVAGVNLVILANSTAARLVVGTANLIVDVPAGEKFFLISRDGTAMPNTVLIGNEAQTAAAQSCSLNAQGQATSNVLPLFGATSGTKTVTITPVSGTKCTAPGGGSSSGGGGGGGAVSVGGSAASTTTTTTTTVSPSTPNFVDGGTAAGTTGQVAAPSASGTTSAPKAATSVTPTAPVAAPSATPTEIKKQTADVATKALDVVTKALEKAAAAAPAVASAPSSTVGSAQAAAPVPVVQVSSTASTIAAKFVPTDATPTERAIMQVIVDNPPPAALKKGMGEWGGALNSTRIANNGDIPTEPEKLKAFVANAGLVLNGRFPLPEFKNPDLEQKMIALLEVLYGRKMAPSEDPPGLYDRNAIIVATYGLRQVERKLEKEKACEKPVTDTLVNKGRVIKNSGEYWNLVNACAYSGATR